MLPFLSTFWLEATSTATYLINRLPTKTLNMQSPYQKLYNKSPSFLHLKTFGCLCYPWTTYNRTHKLDPKYSLCIFIGYSTDHRGFLCFNPIISKLIISRHVRFHEHEFLMIIPPPTPLPPPLLPTLYPTLPTSSPPPTQPPTIPPTIPPPNHSNTHIQYQSRCPQTNTSPTSTLPPLLPIPAPKSTTTPFTRPPSTHPMTTRSQQTTPKTSLNLSLTTSDPINYTQVSSDPNWHQAMSTKIQALQQQHTWQLVPKPPNRPILGSK